MTCTHPSSAGCWRHGPFFSDAFRKWDRTQKSQSVWSNIGTRWKASREAPCGVLKDSSSRSPRFSGHPQGVQASCLVSTSVSVTGNFNINTFGHMKMNILFVRDTRHFTQELSDLMLIALSSLTVTACLCWLQVHFQFWVVLLAIRPSCCCLFFLNRAAVSF